jgi:predicted nucleic acid-binding Zn ribbon protein
MKNQQFKSLGDSVKQVLQEYGLEKRVKQHQAIIFWQQIVGGKLAEVSKAERITDNTLYVRVKSMAWRTELQFQKHSILERIANRVGAGVIEDIRFY